MQQAMEEKFLIIEGVDYKKAKQGDEFELAKIAFIVLIHGSSFEVAQINDSFESLEESHYNLMTNSFYSLVERNKLKFPPKSVEIYKEFLSMPNLTRCSISKDTRRSASVDYSFRARNKRKLDELELFNEKKKLEREINNKDACIYDLQCEVEESKQMADEFRQKYESCKRKFML